MVQYDLVFSALLAVLGALCVMIRAPLAFRIIVSVLILLFVPGYLFILVLVPRREDVSLVLRFGLSVVCSVAQIGMLSLLLSLSPVGLSAQTLAVQMGLLISILIVIAAWRRQTIVTLGEEPYIPGPPTWLYTSFGKTPLSPTRLFFIAAILLAAGTVCLSFVVPAPQERFTELIAYDYALPDIGSNASLLIEVRNHEGVPVNYSLVTLLMHQTDNAEFNRTVSSPVGLLNWTTVPVNDGASGSVVLSVPPNGTSGANRLDVLLFPTDPQSSMSIGQLNALSYRNLSIRLPGGVEE